MWDNGDSTPFRYLQTKEARVARDVEDVFLCWMLTEPRHGIIMYNMEKVCQCKGGIRWLKGG